MSADGWELPVIASPAALADRFELDIGQLRWLADLRGLERWAVDEPLRNYRYRIVPRRSGGLPRLLEIPKARLKEIQRRILHEILDPVPAHPAAHGFRAGHSVVSHAAVHSGQAMVISLDLADFFCSIRRPRIAAVFRGLGCRAEIARLLAGLCTTTTAESVWRVMEAAVADGERGSGRRSALERMLASPHLPQGAPTSPALANLAVFGLDRRLDGLARAFGLRYSRYADDLTFSGARLGDHRRRTLVAFVTEIALDEGLAINPDKTRVHLAGGRQPVCGVIVNAHPNVPRAEYDRLAAILHNCVRFGPAEQNRAGVAEFRAHLRGRIAWVSAVNPARGAKLAAEFARIHWDGAV